MNYSQYITIFVELPILGEVEFFAHASEFSLENDSIGSYECHGFRGYDEQEDYIQVNDIHWHRYKYSESQNEMIWDWVNEQSGGENCPYQKLCDLAGGLFDNEY